MNKRLRCIEFSVMCGALLCFLTVAGVAKGEDRAADDSRKDRPQWRSGRARSWARRRVTAVDAQALPQPARPPAGGRRGPTPKRLARHWSSPGCMASLALANGKSGTLPFIDNFVNLLIVEQAEAIRSRRDPARAGAGRDRHDRLGDARQAASGNDR